MELQGTLVMIIHIGYLNKLFKERFDYLVDWNTFNKMYHYTNLYWEVIDADGRKSFYPKSNDLFKRIW